MEIEGAQKTRRVVIVLEENDIKILAVAGPILRTVNCASFEVSKNFPNMLSSASWLSKTLARPKSGV